MSDETLRKRQEILVNLPKYLKIIKETVQALDSEAQIFMFGSFEEKTVNYSSPIGVLIITKHDPAKIHSELWKKEIKEPFEIHTTTPAEALFYMAEAKLTKI